MDVTRNYAQNPDYSDVRNQPYNRPLKPGILAN